MVIFTIASSHRVVCNRTAVTRLLPKFESSSDPVIAGQMVDQVAAAAVELFEGTTNEFPSHFSAVRS